MNTTDHHMRTIQDLRSLKTIHTPTQALMSSPTYRLNQTHPQMATSYDQALGAIKENLNSAITHWLV